MLEGDLGDFSIAEVLQLLGYTRKTGRLQLHGPTSAGRIVVAEGSLLDITADVARIGVVRRLLGLGYVGPEPIFELLEDTEELPSDRQLLTTLVERGHLDAEQAAQVGRTHALESLAELLRWTEGSFRFDADPQAAEGIDPSEALPAETLMEEAKERLADWDQLIERVGPGDQVVTLNSPVPPRDVTIPAAGWGLLMFVDGRRTVDELAALSGRGAYDTRVALIDLLDQGLVTLSADASGGEDGLAEAIARIAQIEAAHHPGATVDAAAAFGNGVDDDRGDGLQDTADVVDDAQEPQELQEQQEQQETHDTHDANAAAGPGDAEVATEPTADEPTAGDRVDEDDVDAGEEAQPAEAELAAVEGAEGPPPPPDPRNLQTKVRGERLRTDPSIDEDLVSRLIDGVEGM